MFELNTSDTGLVYRARRGQPQGPLIVMLHGLSGDETVMWLFERSLPPQATLVSPRALYASDLGGYSWSRSAEPRDLASSDFANASETLRGFVAELVQHYPVDPNRVIVLGFSQGAAAAYALSLTVAEPLCGVVALAGFLPPQLRDLTPRADFPRNGYLILHGTQDEDVPIEQARHAQAVLIARGALVTYHEYAVGHKVAAQGMKDMTRWLQGILFEAR